METTKKWLKKPKTVLLDFLICTIGSALFAIGTHYFTAPHQIAPGGVTGLATLINYLFGFPIGAGSILLNLPLVVLGLIFLGKPFIIKSAYCVVSYSIFLDVIFSGLPVFESDNTLLAALFGGVVMGAGLGMIFMRNASTGGTDIGARLLQRRFPHISMGKLMQLIDIAVVVTSIFVYSNMESPLYAVICIFTCTKVIDAFLYGQDVSKQVMIITDHPEACSKALIEELDRGLTLFHGEGGYTGTPKKILVCVLRRTEYHAVKQTIKRVDPHAFMIVSEVSEVLGEGFKTEN